MRSHEGEEPAEERSLADDAREARAQVAASVDPRPTFIWDYAAGALLLHEAGGRLTTLDGQSFLDTLPVQRSEGWVAASDGLHPSIQAAVAAALRNVSGMD